MTSVVAVSRKMAVTAAKSGWRHPERLNASTNRFN
jgi:hypothetical protein